MTQDKSDKISMKKKHNILFFIIISLCIICFYFYSNAKKQKILYYFHKPECKFCVLFNPIWEEIINDSLTDNVKCIKIDISKPINKKLVSNFNIEGVPTLYKIHSDGTRYSFTGDRNSSDILSWII